MRVRRLEINGFKSFADRTVLDFPESMCAVVGPNGCGKSNVVDAIRWVLGEQSAKQLRGQAMGDVIFAGSQGRKDVGAAEVSLVLENNGSVSHPQFADLPEIMITRRLFRSGDSDYLINKMPCRLKDIQQLLMDTGLGNRAYSIIEQGRVAAFIEARPEERRLWVEEAAGITRYKNQKKVSLRKMEAAKDNLDRLNDILHEVETQMNRLQRQAKKAQRHKELRTQIRELDLNIASFEYNRLTRQLEDLDAEAEAVGAQLLLANQRVTGLETDLETMKVQLVSAEQEISQAGARRLETQGAIQKAENELTLLGREAENTRRLGERYATEREELKLRLQAQERDLARARRLSEEGDARLAQSQAAVESAESRVRELKEAVAVREAQVDACKEALVEHLSQASQAKNRLSDLERARAELFRRREQVAARQSTLQNELAQIEGQASQRESSLAGLKGELAQLEARLAELEQSRQERRQGLNDLAKAEQEALRTEQQLSAKTDALSAALASHDWAGAGVREVLDAAADGRLPVEVLGLVAERLSVTPGQEPLVEAALGPDLQALIVRSGADAQALAAFVDQAGLGRLRVVALDDLKPLAAAPDEAQSLAQLVKPQPGFEPLAALISGVGHCPDLSQAWQAGSALSAGQSLVTLAGQRLDRPGAALVGRAAEDAAAVLARQNDLAALRDEFAAAGENLRQAVLDRERAEADLSDLEKEHTVLSGGRGDLERDLRAKEQELFRFKEEAAAKRRQMEGLDYDAEEIAAELERSEGEEARLREALEENQAQHAGLEEDLRQAQEDLSFARDDLEEARAAEGEARLAAANVASQAEHAGREAHRLTQETEAALKRISELEAEMQGATQTVDSLIERRNGQQNQLGSLYQELDRQEEAHRQAREVLNQAQMRHSDLESSLKRARAEQREVESQSGELSLGRKEILLSRDNVCEQILDRCRVDLTYNYQAHLPEGSFDPETSRERLNKLRTRLNRLGPVNMEAITEHEALAERHTFLSEQKTDLESSLEDLRQAIRKINKTSRTRFTETLELVNKRLGDVFPVLFGGGQAQLILDEGVDPLDAGLHLMVEPPGKKLKNIEALSGGEKAMSVAAVLFALFLIRPAPFCVLDEVDAPLDEANVGRFHDLLRELSKRSQIVMITHHRRTMEIMDVLYGVTMEEKGVSKLLTVDLAQGESMAA
jgi:chromosome segregation protein